MEGKCVFHTGDGSSEGSITLFNEKTLEKCKQILSVRKSKSLKYSDAVIPDTVDMCSGFHIECYRKFTALGKYDPKYKEKNDNEQETVYTTRSTAEELCTSSSTGVMPQICIFCAKKDKKHNGHKQKLISVETTNFEEKVKEYAKCLDDQKLLSKLGSVNFVAKEIRYHSICRSKYQTSAEQVLKRRGSKGNVQSVNPWHLTRETHMESFRSMCRLIEDRVIVDGDVMTLNDAYNTYVSLLEENGSNNNSTYTAQKLEEKIKKHFEQRIVIHKRTHKKSGNLIFSSAITLEQALKLADSPKSKLDKCLKDAAFTLRQIIKDASYNPLPPSGINIDHIMNGEIEIPKEVLQFFKYLVGGPDQRSHGSASKCRRIESLSADTIFAVTNGRKKPSKHLKLGLVMKSMTGSKKVLEILNRYGHCASYTITEEMETELTFSVTTASKISPPDMQLNSSLCTGIAFDNFDRFVETLSGKDTLHDTVGITYQRIPSVSGIQHGDVSGSLEDTSEPPGEFPESSEARQPQNRRKRRRTLEPVGLEIEPYHKKPKIVSRNILPLDDARRQTVPESYHKAKIRDFAWMIQFSFLPQTTPMWVGWNAKQHKDCQPTEKLWYLPPVNQSPTSTAVVKETMKRAQQLAKECKKDEIAVTYDLAIAKMALEIQATEAPQFENLFVSLGSFHVEMSFFGILGKYIAESGGPYLLTECHIIEKGSLTSFLAGKCYKRNKRIHQLLSLAMELEHFNLFQLSLEEDDLVTVHTMEDELTSLLETNATSDLVHDIEDFLTETSKQMLEKYERFTENTRSGINGKTAQYWMGYIDMVHLYHKFSRSIRTGDLTLYIYCLQRLAAFFFTFNHHNYSRWLVVYHDNLLKLPVTHPEIYREFKNGGFSMKRTSKSFSRLPIDLTLEQTINADAACQRSGITALTNSISARQRWAQSHSLRTSIISKVLDELCLTTKEDVSEELKPHRIRQNCKDLSKISQAIKEMMNPFSTQLEKDNLFNISTGKAASNETSEFLLNVYDIGTKSRDTFIKDCSEDPSNFKNPIKRQRIKNFATENGRYKISSKDKKLVSVSMTRDLFGSILFHALQAKVDMEEVLKYPLTPVPLSLSHVDGSMQKTPKSKLLEEIEKRVESSPPEKIDVTVIDGMFFLHLLYDPPSTFGGVASHILRQVCKQNGSEIHLVFDKTISPSIKDAERCKRSDNRNAAYQITGADQKRPTNWLNALRQDEFKEALVDFLTGYWENEFCAAILGSKKLFVNNDNTCFSFQVIDNRILKLIESNYWSTHEEADTRMIFHIAKLSSPANVVVRTVDTDVVIIALGCMNQLQDKNIWIEAGLQSKNTLRYISINQIFNRLGEPLCKSLPAFHAFTGCDYTPSFNRKGKITPLKLLEKNNKVQEVFRDLGESEQVTEEIRCAIESFVCQMYGKPKLTSVDQARLDVFLLKYKPKKRTDGLINQQQLKKLDSTTMPPCSKVLMYKIKRCCLITSIWQNATKAEPTTYGPTNFGWYLEDGRYNIRWFDGDIAPKIGDVVEDNDCIGYGTDDDEISDDSDDDDDDMVDGEND